MPEIDLGSVVGPQGPQGVPGPVGAQGIQGIQGEPGEAGKSAYQAARDGGYTGTEAEFNAIMAIINAHAGRHKTGGADPLTAADVGAAPAFAGNIKADNLLDWAKTQNASVCGFATSSNVPDGLPVNKAGYVFVSASGVGGWSILYYCPPENSIYFNMTNVSEWVGWKKIGTTDSVYDLTIVGTAIPENGDLNNYKTPGEIYCSPNAERSATIANTPFTSAGFKLVVERGYNASIIAQNLYCGGSSLRWYRNYYGSNGWSSWFRVATTDYALPRDGSEMMTGSLGISPGSGARIHISCDSATGYMAVYTHDESGVGWNNRRMLQIPTTQAGGIYQNLDYVGLGANPFRYNIFHTGNKPSASYVGTNGEQTVPIGGSGSVLAITSEYGLAIVTGSGAILSKFDTADAVSYAEDIISYKNGILTINTSYNVVNEPGKTYDFQVL